jgi:hypothetical protein
VPHALALWAARPAAASVRFCAVASHSAGIPQSRLAPPLLGVLTKAGYSCAIAFKRTTNIQASKWS